MCKIKITFLFPVLPDPGGDRRERERHPGVPGLGRQPRVQADVQEGLERGQDRHADLLLSKEELN